MTFAHLHESAPIAVMNTQGSETGASGAAAVRVRAVRLVCTEGWSTADAALAVGRSQRSVQLWVQRSQRGKKPERLATKKAPGATPKLDKKQQTRLIKLLQAGPEAAGFLSQLWTGPRIAELIEREFGVTYHANYLPALLRSFGMTVQRPKSRPTERDEEQIAHWINHRWPAIKKSPTAQRVADFPG
jgi:transposase